MNPATGTEQAARQARQVTAGELAAEAARLLAAGYRLAMVAAHDDQDALRVVYVFCAGPPDRRAELEVRLDPGRPVVPSLAGLSFPASRFEREIHDLFGIIPDGHPFLRRLVLHQHWPQGWHPMRRDAGPPPPMQAGAEPFPFVTVDGPGVYEIPVGPVHAGLIEPGHFRFSVVGETILKMKARLWFLHRGVERLFEGQDPRDAVQLAECVSGDSAVAHNLAYCLAVEDACQIPVPDDAARLRAMLLELERLYNHVADIGALCNDVGFGLAQARALTPPREAAAPQRRGHRPPAAPRRDPPRPRLRPPAPRRRRARRDQAALRRDHRARHLQHRRHGPLHRHRRALRPRRGRHRHPRLRRPRLRPCPRRPDRAPLHRSRQRIPPGRGRPAGTSWPASPSGSTRSAPPSASSPNSPGRPARSAPPHREAPRRGGSGLGIVEGWRGTIVHRVEVGSSGTLTRCKIVDPSFLNWPALSVALADTIVPDFPLANKSFNLSYAGNDL